MWSEWFLSQHRDAQLTVLCFPALNTCSGAGRWPQCWTVQPLSTWEPEHFCHAMGRAQSRGTKCGGWFGEFVFSFAWWVCVFLLFCLFGAALFLCNKIMPLLSVFTEGKQREVDRGRKGLGSGFGSENTNTNEIQQENLSECPAKSDNSCQ